MRNKLIKTYNKLYFTSFQDTDLLPVKEPPDKDLLHTVLTLADDYDTEMC